MQRRVIKVNLMALILTILLIISAIVCGIIYIPKMINKSKEKQQLSNNQMEENKEEKVKIHSQYGDIEFNSKINKSELGYSMKYDIDWFRVESSNTGGDYYVSSKYNNLLINVYKQFGNFDQDVSKIYQENYNMPNDPTSTNNVLEYRVTDETLNEKISHIVKKHFRTKDIIEQEYYINSANGEYFVIKLSCPTRYEPEVFPIMEEMIKTFEIL